MVEAGFTGISNADGSISARPSTTEEIQAALQISRVDDRDNRLEFDLRDGRGNTRRLKIEFKD